MLAREAKQETQEAIIIKVQESVIIGVMGKLHAEHHSQALLRDDSGAVWREVSGICSEYASSRHAGAAPIRRSYIRQLMERQKLTNDLLIQMLNINKNTLENVFNDRKRISRWVVNRLCIVLCSTDDEIDELARMFDILSTKDKAEGRIVRLLVRLKAFLLITGILDKEADIYNCYIVFWAMLLAYLKSYDQDLCADFGRIKQSMDEIDEIGRWQE